MSFYCQYIKKIIIMYCNVPTMNLGIVLCVVKVHKSILVLAEWKC